MAGAENIHLISVNGLAETSVEPNMIVVQIESWGKGASAKTAQENQATQFIKIKNLVEKYKIKKDDFKTENYSVNPDSIWDQKTQRNKISGYRASHQISLTLREIDKAGQLIDDLTSAGKNDLTGGVSIQNTTWDTDKKATLENSVLNDAVHNARSKAEELAKAAGVKIKTVHRISFSSNAVAQGEVRQFSLQMASEKAQSTELSSDKIKIRVEVQMEFEI